MAHAAPGSAVGVGGSPYVPECTYTHYTGIGSAYSGKLYQPGHNTGAYYQLAAIMVGLVDNFDGAYCGKMEAQAQIYEYAGLAGGSLSATLWCGNGCGAGPATINSGTGGTNGAYYYATTGSLVTVCGQIHATFNASNGWGSLSVYYPDQSNQHCP